MTTSDFSLSARDLACERGGRLVFEGVSFSLSRGEALVLTGPNGAGKSSLLRQIAGLLEVAGGEIALMGGDPERSIGEQTHYVGHLDALKPSMSGTPQRRQKTPMIASSSTTRMSHQSASSRPPATACESAAICSLPVDHLGICVHPVPHVEPVVEAAPPRHLCSLPQAIKLV